MRILSNVVADIVQFFREELHACYDVEELEEIIWLSFNHVLGFSRSDLTLRSKHRVQQSELLKLNFICKDLRMGKPIQYVLGETEFCGMKLKVNESVLIPRPETEEMVYLFQSLMKEETFTERPRRILDIGTGSGCIALAVKKLIPGFEVWASDVSPEALAVAQYNATQQHIEINFVQDDILNPAELLQHGNFSVILSNPPYISIQEKYTLHSRVLDHEPHLALFAHEEDALVFYRAIFNFAPRVKTTFLLMELHPDFATQVLEIGEKSGYHCEIIQDMYGKKRFLKAVKN